MTIKKIYSLFSKNYLVDTDTRNIRKNSIFFSLKGENFNGNKYASEALKKGAIYAIVDEEKYQTNKSIILVDNVLHCLQELAQYHRKILNIPILALTGSNGKTTTKELINAVLNKKFKTVATHENLNNHIGVPLTLLSMNSQTEFGIVEMGANHLNEIKLLCEIAKPNYGYITNFGKAHLEGFGSKLGVIKGKSELYDFIKKNNGIAIINPNDSIQLDASKTINSILFEDSLKFIEANPFVHLSFKGIDVYSQLIGKYNYTNIAAAITIGNYFNVSIKNIISAIENYTPTNNRSQIIEKNGHKIILDAYNANPSSMLAALENFNTINDPSKIIILGDMFELGKTSLEEHQKVVEYVEQLHSKSIYLLGEQFLKTKTKRAIKFIDFEDFKTSFKSSDFKNSTILIKGSRGMALERILELL